VSSVILFLTIVIVTRLKMEMPVMPMMLMNELT
jgi:hypothetical protein